MRDKKGTIVSSDRVDSGVKSDIFSTYISFTQRELSWFQNLTQNLNEK